VRPKTQTSELDSGYSWLRLAVAVAIATVSSVGIWSVVVVLPEVQAEFGVGRGAASIAYTATMLGFAAGNLIVGRLVDRIGITVALALSALLLAAGYALAAVSTGIATFALAQGLLIGAGAAVGFGPMMADVSLWFERRRGVAVAITACGNYLAGVVWPLFLKEALEVSDWRTAHLAIAVICLFVVAPLGLLLRRRPSAASMQAARGAQARLVAASPFSPRALTWLLAFAGLACCTAMSMPQVHIVAYCADLGYGVAVGAEMLAVMLGAGIVSRLASGFLADYIGGVRTVLLGSVLQAVSLALYLPYDGMAALYVVSMVFGLAQGGIVPGYAIIVREYLPAEEAGQRIGFVIMATILGMALGGWMSGWIFDLTGSYQMAFINGIAWNLLNIGLIALLLWRTRAPRVVPA
jgi:MFS family permease